ncbi:DUF6883 domain-containing protein [Acidocella facilis]|uniref:DUF6883 domain-containing protein n=1 Tax=Acidocella facilis TaxID=525 RepID=UPI001F30F1CD|nr:DUF6883 domain-containing protein [Acidocella facilis]
MRYVVPDEKITDYLLKNQSKSGFFLRYYDAAQWQQLRDDILNTAPNCEVIFQKENEWGKKYIINMELSTPKERVIKITTVWMIRDDDLETYSLLTAYPT